MGEKKAFQLNMLSLEEILAKEKGKSKEKLPENPIASMDHVLMRTYGWIPSWEWNGLEFVIDEEVEFGGRLGRILSKIFHIRTRSKVKVAPTLPIPRILGLMEHIQMEAKMTEKEMNKVK